MCGRFVQFSPSRVYADMFGILGPLPDLPPRYNLAPTQPVLAARASGRSGIELVTLRWGLVPSWSKGPDARFSMINARAESVHQKPAYRGPFRYRRCLIPSEGFYEWQAEDGRKQPWFIQRADGLPFAMAGLWERWQDPAGNELESCSILVTRANAAIAPLHERMPVILDAEDWPAWLDPANQRADGLLPLLQPYGGAPMHRYRVSTRVNRPSNEGAQLIEPL